MWTRRRTARLSTLRATIPPVLTPRALRRSGSAIIAVSPTLGIAACFGLAATLARLALTSGLNVISLTTARTAFALLALALLLRSRPGAAVLTGAERRAAAVLGLVLCVQVYCLYKAVELMPVGLAITAYYSFPLMVVLGNALLDRRPISFATLWPVLLAAVGIVLVLDAQHGGWHAVGLAYALVAASSGCSGPWAASARPERPPFSISGPSRPCSSAPSSCMRS